MNSESPALTQVAHSRPRCALAALCVPRRAVVKSGKNPRLPTTTNSRFRSGSWMTKQKVEFYLAAARHPEAKDVHTIPIAQRINPAVSSIEA